MKKSVLYTLTFSGMMMLASCNGNMSQFAADYFTTNPNPLEVVGQNVPAVVTANVPAKFFKKNASVTVTPTLVYAGGEATSQPYTFQGEKVRGNAPVISYDNGGTVSMPVNFVYTPEMAKSELYLNFAVTQGSKQYVLPRVKVADGVIATATLADAGTVTPANSLDKFQRIINEKYKANIYFLINVANIRKGQLESDEMVAFNKDLRDAAADENRQIKELNIESYASPDGPWDFNEWLAQKREDNTTAYLKDQLKKDAITEFGELTANFTPEDWEGFKTLVSESNIQDKDLIISVLSMYKDPAEREREIRNMASVFNTLEEDIMPKLRYSRLSASIDVIGKSDDEINNLINTDPSQLTIEELLYGATLTTDNGRREKIYTEVVKLFPNDYRGYNNLGLTQYVNKDYAKAVANFNKAAQLNPSAPEVQMNKGLIAMVNNDYSAANAAFGKAGGQEGLNEALGVYYLKQGDAAAAAKSFGNSISNNAALSQILTKNYSKAQSTLSAIANPDATTYYLTAVLGARTNNASMVQNNLQKAIALNPAYAQKAANDLEFARFNVK